MSDLKALETWAGALLHKVGPAERKRLAASVARTLRKGNTRRMARQLAPDGSRWEPRKQPTMRDNARTLRKKGPMMAGLRRAKHLRAKGYTDEAVVEFVGRAQRIARVHHFGEADNVNPGAPPRYEYPARALLGFGQDELDGLRDLVLQHLAS